MAETRPNEVYYYEIGEGRWQGEFHFRITDWRKFFEAKLPRRDFLLATLLNAVERLPGEAVMHGEIACDPEEPECGVARVDVSVERFGFEIYRLRGHYALQPDGIGVKIKIYQRFGPYGSPLENEKLATAEILEDGLLGVYYMKIFGQDWVGRYRLDPERKNLKALYECPWGITEEIMNRLVPVKPISAVERQRWDSLLQVARELERLNRQYEVAGDPRALFTYAYGVVTRSIAFTLVQAEFDDPDWVIALAKAFALRYVKAAADHDLRRAPPAWAYVFRAMDNGRLSGLAELVLSMTAHILHDLPLALLEVGMTDSDGVPRTADFHEMNEILASSIDLLQDRLSARYSPLFKTLDILGTDLDELMSRAGVSHARAIAWYTAERLADPDEREHVMQDVERDVQASVDRILGRTYPKQLLFRGVHGAIRLFRRRPLFPTPTADEFKRLDATPRRPKPVDRDEDLLYGLHTAIGQNRSPSRSDALRTASSEAVRKGLLPVARQDLADKLASPRRWEDARARANEDESFRWRLGALTSRLGAADGAPFDAGALGIADEALDAIRSLQDALGEGLKRGFDGVAAELVRIAKLLDMAGVPVTETLGGFDDLRAHYDAATDRFEVEVPSLMRMDLDDIKWLIEPQNWALVIPHMLRSDWIDGPDEHRRGVIREVVNVYHPWVDDHPLMMVNDLAIAQIDTPDERRVEYTLEKSIEGALLVDEGYISLRRLETGVSLLVIQKTLQVDAGRNPLLYALLRSNPDGLAYLFTYWVSSVAKRFGEPNEGREG